MYKTFGRKENNEKKASDFWFKFNPEKLQIFPADIL